MMSSKNLDWKRACESQMTVVKDKELQDFRKDIDRQQKQDKYIKAKGRILRKTSKEVGDKIAAQRRAYSQ